MTQKDKKKLATLIGILSGQRFWDFYAKVDGEFDYYLGNRMDNPKMKAEVEAKLLEIFKDVK